MKGTLQGIGLLTTASRPPSIIYFFTMKDDGLPTYYRRIPAGDPHPLPARSTTSSSITPSQVEDVLADLDAEAGEEVEPSGT